MTLTAREKLMNVIERMTPQEMEQYLPSEREIQRRIDANRRAPSVNDNNGPPTVARKRVLNSFMAFRSYYTPVFPNIPQFERSTLLTLLWGPEPAKAKWNLIASCYSFVRDEVNHRQLPAIQLRTFLDTACDIMNLTPPSEYLETHGWSVNGAGADGAGVSLIYGRDARPPQGTVLMSEFDLLFAMFCRGFDLRGIAERLLMDLATKYHGNIPIVSAGSGDTRREGLARLLQRAPRDIATTLIGTYKPYLQSSVEYMDQPKPVLGHPDQPNQPVQQAEKKEQEKAEGKYHSYPPEDYLFANTSRHLYNVDDPVFDASGVDDFAGYDLGNPFDIDELLGEEFMDGEATLGMQEGVPYDPKANHHNFAG